MGPEYFWWGGMWVFPLIMILVMLLVVYLIFGRGGFRGHAGTSMRATRIAKIPRHRLK